MKKLFCQTTSGVYTKEKSAYETIEAKGVQHLFVPQGQWDDTSLTAVAGKISSAKPTHSEAVAEILAELKQVGLTLNDLDRGDNVGQIPDGNGGVRNVVFDAKSLEEYKG